MKLILKLLLTVSIFFSSEISFSSLHNCFKSSWPNTTFVPNKFAAIVNLAGRCGSFGGKNFGLMLVLIFKNSLHLFISSSLYFCLCVDLCGTGIPPVLANIPPTRSQGFSIISALYIFAID